MVKLNKIKDVALKLKAVDKTKKLAVLSASALVLAVAVGLAVNSHNNSEHIKVSADVAEQSVSIDTTKMLSEKLDI